jgi:hypothetical protein
MVKLGNNLQPLLLILLFLIVLEGVYSGFNVVLSTASYSTGYQGAKAQYAGVKWNNTEYSGPGFDTTMLFDPDDPKTGMCNLVGEMTSVFIPSQSLSNMPDWIPTEWATSASYIDNPRETYEWETDDLTYTMEAWTLRWYFSISAEWDDPPLWTIGPVKEYSNQRYGNTEIWFEIDLTPTWYFEGQTNAYFAIAKMQLADNAKLYALDNSGEEVEPSLQTSVSPESRGSILPLYYGLFAKQNPAEKQPMDYQGKQLNPDLFVSKLYTHFTLGNFGTHYWLETAGLVQKWKGDVVTFAVDVTVFVIGEWKVQDIEDLEQYEHYGRTAKLGGGYSFEDWLSSPANRLLLVLIAGIALLVILAIVFPSALIALSMLISSLTGGRRK